jgi:hypothetical protein
MTKRKIELRIRGWLPKEMPFPSAGTAQVNQETSRQRLIIVYVTIFVAVFAAVFITLGILEVLSLGSYASYAARAAAAVAAGTASVFVIRRSQSPNISKKRVKQ